ncbi:MAG: hypothetical protein IJU54_02385 [Alphaproteobacteria bacterium]|nr:hypothetical protein [Alphaproteobacteria bacterium]
MNLSTNCVRKYSNLILMSLLALNISNVQSMEDETKEDNSIINTHHYHSVINNVANIANNNNDYEEEVKNNDSQIFNANPLIDIQDPKFSIANILQKNIINNNSVYNSKDKMISNIIRSIDKHPTDYKQQKLEGISIINDKQNNTEYEKLLFSIDDSNLMPKNNIKPIKKELNTLVNDIILGKKNYDDILYNNKSEECKVIYLADALIDYYNNNVKRIFNNEPQNCIAGEYECSIRYMPFTILQMMYKTINKYNHNIACKVINRVYNKNKDQVKYYFNEIADQKEFNQETHKKNKGFLGSYDFEKIPSNKELDEKRGKALADYWEYANHSVKMCPSINVCYTDEYLKQAYNRYSNSIQYALNNIIEKNINNKPIDNVLNYYEIMANRAPNIYLSNNVIDFIHKKLGINDVIYFIDKFINIKQKHLIEEDLPQDNANFINLLNEYPNGNLRDYNINIQTPNCIACIFNSSDYYNNTAGANRIVVDNNKEELYNRLIDANATFHPTKDWRISRYSKMNNDGNKSYNTVFLYYTK